MSKMNNVLAILLASTLGLLTAAPSSLAKDSKPATEAAPIQLKRSLFSGSESMLAEFAWLRPDCTAPMPDVRVAKQPAHGVIRFEEGRATVNGTVTPLQRQCAGKPIEAMRLFYKANDDYAGSDTFTLDVDTKLGLVNRYTFTIDVR